MNRKEAWEAARRARITAAVRAGADEGDTEEEILETIEDYISDELDEEEHDRASQMELHGYPEDTPCIQPEQYMSFHG